MTRQLRLRGEFSASMDRFGRPLLALAAALAMTPPASAGDVRVGILPPEGWTRIDAKGTNLLAAWRDSGVNLFYQNLTLAHDDTPQPLEAYVGFTTKAMETSLPGSVPKTTKITICTNRTAYDLVAVGRYSGVRVRIEEVVTDIGGKKFIGTYTRPEEQQTSDAAETSLRSICPQEP